MLLKIFQYRISNIHFNVTSGDRYPVPDKSAPVYITVGDGGNQEGLAGRLKKTPILSFLPFFLSHFSQRDDKHAFLFCHNPQNKIWFSKSHCVWRQFRWNCRFLDPQPDYSAFREASYGHSTFEIKNRTHAFYHWNRNDDGKKLATDAFVLRNQYWSVY